MDISTQYIAGFFDGEGCVSVYLGSGKNSYYLRTQVTQNVTPQTEVVFQYLYTKYGGNYSKHTSINGKQFFNWQLNSAKAVFFLDEILPYLILKREQAQIAVDWQKQKPLPLRDERGRIKPNPIKNLEYDSTICAKIKSLKY